MSMLRPVNGPCRSASTNFGRDRPPDQVLERRVEPLDVADLQRHAGVGREPDQVVGLGDGRGRSASRRARARRGGGTRRRRSGGRWSA